MTIMAFEKRAHGFLCTHAGAGACAARRARWRIANGRSGGARVLLQVQALLQQRLQLPAAPGPIKRGWKRSVHGNQ